MRLLTLVRILCLNHIRRGALLFDAIMTALIIAAAFNPWLNAQEWSFVVFVYGVAACLLPGLATIVISGSAASQRGEPFMLQVGRPVYYLSVMTAGFLMGLLWVGVLGVALLFLTVTGAPVGWAGLLAGTVALNALLASALFTLLSPLCGGSKEVVGGILLVILGLNSARFGEFEALWLQRLEYFVPPLMVNMTAAIAGATTVLRSGAYLAALLALGILRFWRREFSRT